MVLVSTVYVYIAFLPMKLMTLPDRSNDFEKKYFQAQNTRARREYEHNQWSVEDM